jgi:MarR family transcriptional regulator, organic hydroperoxide resistance regulator
MEAVNETQRIEDWQLLARFALAYRSLSDVFMDQVSMHRAQATVLCRLYLQDGMSQTEIARQLAVQGPTATDMLQRMEEAGLIARQRDPENNRLVRVYLTEAGRDKKRSVSEQFSKLERAVFENFNEEERAQLRQLLERMLQNIGSCRVADGP